jgi:hypothetical protein
MPEANNMKIRDDLKYSLMLTLIVIIASVMTGIVIPYLISSHLSLLFIISVIAFIFAGAIMVMLKIIIMIINKYHKN